VPYQGHIESSILLTCGEIVTGLTVAAVLTAIMGSINKPTETVNQNIQILPEK
jgi:hypothetical protein